ncbi:hypothetical protein EST38_g2035, partial [Candolleomyces aberdarensis]
SAEKSRSLPPPATLVIFDTTTMAMTINTSSPAATDDDRSPVSPVGAAAADAENTNTQDTTTTTAANSATEGGESTVKSTTSNINTANNIKRKPSRRANTAERRATHNAVERQRRETLNGRFLDLAALLPNLSQIRRPSKSSIVNSSIAHIHASRRHRMLASRELRLVKAESDALRRELNDWRDQAFAIVVSGEMDALMQQQQQQGYMQGPPQHYAPAHHMGAFLDEEGRPIPPGKASAANNGNPFAHNIPRGVGSPTMYTGEAGQGGGLFTPPVSRDGPLNNNNNITSGGASPTHSTHSVLSHQSAGHPASPGALSAGGSPPPMSAGGQFRQGSGSPVGFAQQQQAPPQSVPQQARRASSGASGGSPGMGYEVGAFGYHGQHQQPQGQGQMMHGYSGHHGGHVGMGGQYGGMGGMHGTPMGNPMGMVGVGVGGGSMGGVFGMMM